MQRILLIVLVAVVVLVALVLAYAATKPDTFRVQRSALVKAPLQTVSPLISDFHRWGAWSPWEKLDPELKRTYNGAASGKGAVYAWEGNAKVGKGRMEIIDPTTPSLITIKLDFLAPFEAHNIAEFSLEPEGDATKVTWTMTGPSPYFPAKIMQVFMSMDSMVGKDFEKGLASMGVAAQEASRPA
jgi:hypothetical protein